MADHAITVSNTMNVFGPGPSTKWNGFNWAESNWGYGDPVIKEVGKLVENQTSISDALYKLADKSISEVLTLTWGVDPIEHLDGAGYFYEEPDRQIEMEDRISTGYSQPNSTSASWSEGTPPSTDWS